MVSTVTEIVRRDAFVLTMLETLDESIQVCLYCGIFVDVDGGFVVVSVVGIDQPKVSPICTVTFYITAPKNRI